MSISSYIKKPWSKWHEQLHKYLKGKKDLLPYGSCLLLSISGGQDSMALLKLILDLQRLHLWKIKIWHGDHGWHNRSGLIAKELNNWCNENNLEYLLRIAK